LGVEEIEGDFAGGKSTHVLRSSVTLTIFIQLLEAEVDRTPPRPTIYKFGAALRLLHGTHERIVSSNYASNYAPEPW
jgi:hypothetical protein